MMSRLEGKKLDMEAIERKKSFRERCFAILSTELVKRREPGGIIGTVAVCTGVAMSLFMLYSALSIVPFYIFLTVYFGGTSILVFILYPARENSPNRLTVFDYLLIAATVATVVYFITQFEVMEDRVGMISKPDFFFGLLSVVVSLECCRRVLGPLLPGIGLLLIIYCLFGLYFPGDLGHKGFTLQRIVEFFYSLEGIFGVICRVYATYIFLFILFGAFLTATRAGDFFIDIALSLVGMARGGAAKVAVLGSGFIGSIVGSGSANVAITGIFTIPMMKKTGFRPHVAAALEAAASIGGHITPPVMGTVIFLLASLTETPYIDVVKISIIPAILWYFSIYVIIHFHAVKHGIRGMERKELPNFWETLKKGWPRILPVVTLVLLLGMRFSPHLSAVYSIFCMLIVAMIRKDTRFTLRSLIQTLHRGATSSLTMGSTAGTMGIILAGITFPGMALKFSSLILSYSHGILPIVMVLVLIAAYILGMGMTVTPAYVVLAVLAAPALLELGIPLLAAHLAIVWFSQSSPLTPPFCLAAFVGAGIAESNPMKTGFTSVRFGFALYIVPFIMVYKPLLLNGPWGDVCFTVLGSFAGIAIAAVAVEGFCLGPLNWFFRIFSCLPAGLLLFGTPILQLLGLGLTVVLYLIHRNLVHRGRQLPLAVES